MIMQTEYLFLLLLCAIVLSLIMTTRASLTINKYLEEFPGLVHFLYIDRFNHRITAPSLDFTSEETTSLTKKKVRIVEYFIIAAMCSKCPCLQFLKSDLLTFSEAPGTVLTYQLALTKAVRLLLQYTSLTVTAAL